MGLNMFDTELELVKVMKEMEEIKLENSKQLIYFVYFIDFSYTTFLFRNETF